MDATVSGIESSGSFCARRKSCSIASHSRRSSGQTRCSSTGRIARISCRHAKQAALHGAARPRERAASAIAKSGERSGSVGAPMVRPAARVARTSEESAAPTPQNARPPRWAPREAALQRDGSAAAKLAKPRPHERATPAVHDGTSHGSTRRSSSSASGLSACSYSASACSYSATSEGRVSSHTAAALTCGQSRSSTRYADESNARAASNARSTSRPSASHSACGVTQ